MDNKPIKILGLAGEYRSTSKSGMLVNAGLELAKQRGAEVVFGIWLSNHFRLLVKRGAGRIQMWQHSKPFCLNAMPFSRVLRNITGQCRV